MTNSLHRKPIRVLHISDVINRYDFIDNVVRNLDPELFEVQCATFTAASNIVPPDYASAGIEHTVLRVGSRKGYPAALVRLVRLLRARPVDVIHAHHYDPALIAAVASSLVPRTRLVVGRHYSDSIYQLTNGLKRRAYLSAEGLVNTIAARIVAPSTMIKDLLVERQGVPGEKVCVIPYGFDPSRYRLPSVSERAESRLRLGVEGCFVLATVGRLHQEKGHVYLLEAVRRLGLSDLVWLVVGDGPERGSLEASARGAGLGEAVRFLGWRRDALEIMGAADAVVQPTLAEAFSQVMVEALWMGTPLVITDVSGVADLLEDGRSALVVPKADADALAEAIVRLHDEPSLRARLAATGRALVAQKLSAPAVVPLYEQVYLEVARA